MHHQPDFDRDPDRERREGARGGRDEGRFERGPERMAPDEFRHRGRDEEDEESGQARGQQGWGPGQHHQQYQQTYGGQGQYPGNQGYYGYGGQSQDRQGGQGQFGGSSNRGQFGGGQREERYGQGQFGGSSNQGQYVRQGQYGGQRQFERQFGGPQGYYYGEGEMGQQHGGQGQYGGGQRQFGGQPGYYGEMGQQYGGQGQYGDQGQYSRNQGFGSMSGRFEEGRPGDRFHGQFRGKGPKDYVRSDDRIREEVCELLSDADFDASEIVVKVENGEVIFEGTVDSRWAKREAEEIGCQARGVKDCQNHLKVSAESFKHEESATKGKESGNGHTQPQGRQHEGGRMGSTSKYGTAAS